MDNTVLTVELADQVATVTFNRPEAYNALDVELAVALRDACQRLAQDAEVKVVLLKGAGRAFMAGGDLNAMRESPVEALHQLIPPVHEAVELMTGMPKPVVAMVHGAAAGAGLSIALAADCVVAAVASAGPCRVWWACVRRCISPCWGSPYPPTRRCSGG